MSYIYKHKNGVSVRKIEQTDLQVLKDLKDESWYGHLKPAFINLYDQEQWFKSTTGSSTNLFLKMEYYLKGFGILKYTDIDWINRRCVVGFDIFPNMRGKGIGRKAIETEIDFGFEILNLHREDGECLAGNRVIKMNLDCGFKQEGIRVKAVWRSGVWVDLVEVGILREDWEKLDRVKLYGGVCNL